METPIVPQTPLVTAASILPVEESRAKRLQRQQARFRDRGGIFVPSSNRNALVEILLGKASAGYSPQKRRSRSRSCSPTKAREKETNGAKKTNSRKSVVVASNLSVRKSPRKKPAGKKSSTSHSDNEQPEAGPSNTPNTVEKKVSTSRTKTTTSMSTIVKPLPKRRGRPPKKTPQTNNSIVEDDAAPDKPNAPTKHKPVPKSKAKTTTKTRKTTAKPPPKNMVHVLSTVEEDENERSSVAPSITPAKAKTKSKEDKQDLYQAPEPPITNAKAIDIKKPPSGRRQRSHSKKCVGVYTELSDEEVELPEPAAKPREVKPDKPDTSPPTADTTSGKPKKPAKKGLELTEPNEADRPPDSQADIANDKAGLQKQESVAKLSSQKQKKSATSPLKRPREPDVTNEQRPFKKRTPKIVSQAGLELEDDIPLPARSSQWTSKQSKHNATPTKDLGDSSTVNLRKCGARKRSYQSDDDDTEAPAPTKRKRVISPDEQSNGPVGTKKCKPAARKGRASSPLLDSHNDDLLPTKPKQKENHSVRKALGLPKKSTGKPVRAKPRKSVMLRIRQPLPPIEDEEPDPIDFLS